MLRDPYVRFTEHLRDHGHQMAGEHEGQMLFNVFEAVDRAGADAIRGGWYDPSFSPGRVDRFWTFLRESYWPRRDRVDAGVS